MQTNNNQKMMKNDKKSYTIMSRPNNLDNRVIQKLDTHQINNMTDDPLFDQACSKHKFISKMKLLILNREHSKIKELTDQIYQTYIELIENNPPCNLSNNISNNLLSNQSNTVLNTDNFKQKTKNDTIAEITNAYIIKKLKSIEENIKEIINETITEYEYLVTYTEGEIIGEFRNLKVHLNKEFDTTKKDGKDNNFFHHFKIKWRNNTTELFNNEIYIEIKPTENPFELKLIFKKNNNKIILY